MDSHVIEKALEVWTLQNLLNFSILEECPFDALEVEELMVE